MTFLDDSSPSYWTGQKSKPLSFSKTASPDFLETDVQHPNTTATLSFSSNCAAFSAKSGQLDAGSTTTASSFLPSNPPFLFWASIIIRIVSFSVVSLMAIVPESECSTPTLMVFWADATLENPIPAIRQALINIILRFISQLLYSEVKERWVTSGPGGRLQPVRS